VKSKRRGLGETVPFPCGSLGLHEFHKIFEIDVCAYAVWDMFLCLCERLKFEAHNYK